MAEKVNEMPVTRNQPSAMAQAKATPENAEASMSKDNTDQGETSAEVEPPRRDSPDNCSICLGPFNNKSFTSSCAHSFCFVCLKQWSKVKAECPLCKQPFTSIFHNIRSIENYDIYELPLNTVRQPEYNYYNYGGIPTFTHAPHHYFGLSQPGLDADLTLSNFSRFQFRHRRYLNPSNVHGEHPYSFSGPVVNLSTHLSAATWPRGAEDFRREVYNRYLGPPTVILGTENSTYCLTPAMMAASSHRMNRIMPWLTRELKVLLRSHQSVRLAISLIQPLLTQVTVNSQYFKERVHPLIGRRTQQFINEFVAFTNSAMTVQAYDRKALYRRRDNTTVGESSSNSSSEDDVVEVTDISPDVQETAAPMGSSTTGQLPSSSNFLQTSGWDSPTPGPSWSSVATATTQAPLNSMIQPEDQVSVSSESDDPVFRPGVKESDSEDSKAGSDIVFVRYDKPWNDRSPIRLSSDSEGDDDGQRGRKKKLKHKKRVKLPVDLDQDSKKKDRGRKSSSKSKYKTSENQANARSRVSAEEEEQESVSSHASGKHYRSPSSTDRQRVTRHKKSKEKRDRDRELVDRLFAEAFVQRQTSGQTTEEDETETSVHTRSMDKGKKRRSSIDRTRRRKKHKSRRRGSKSPLCLQSYKKHPSGHKKSSDPRRRNQDAVADRTRHRRRNSSVDRAWTSAPSGSSREPYDVESQESHSQSLAGSSFSHSIPPAFPSSYMPMPDTVQHIPLNLWVSTWPSMPMPHTFPLPPAMDASPNNSSLSTLLSMTANPSTSGPSNMANDSHTISSNSSVDTDTEDTQDDPMETVTSQSDRWRETNFLDHTRSKPSSSTTSATASSTDSLGIAAGPSLARNFSPATAQTPGDNGNESEDVDVLSIPSGDEDIVVCSSASSVNSDNDDVKVVDVELTSDFIDAGKRNTTQPSVVTSSTDVYASIGLPATDNPSLPHDSQPTASHNASSSETGRFQPFKLVKKSSMAKPQADLLFPTQTHSSDEDSVDDFLLHASSPLPCPASNSTNDLHSSSWSFTGRDRKQRGSADPCPFYAPSSVRESSSVQLTVEKSDENNVVSADSQVVTSTSTCSLANGSNLGTIRPFPTASSATSSIFPTLPPLQPPDHPVTSILPTSLGYLPYPSLPSVLPQTLNFGVPQQPPPTPLPLHFPFPPLIHPPPLLPSLYPTFSQGVTSSSSHQGPLATSLSGAEHGSYDHFVTSQKSGTYLTTSLGSCQDVSFSEDEPSSAHSLLNSSTATHNDEDTSTIAATFTGDTGKPNHSQESGACENTDPESHQPDASSSQKISLGSSDQLLNAEERPNASEDNNSCRTEESSSHAELQIDESSVDSSHNVKNASGNILRTNEGLTSIDQSESTSSAVSSVPSKLDRVGTESLCNILGETVTQNVPCGEESKEKKAITLAESVETDLKTQLEEVRRNPVFFYTDLLSVEKNNSGEDKTGDRPGPSGDDVAAKPLLIDLQHTPLAENSQTFITSHSSRSESTELSHQHVDSGFYVPLPEPLDQLGTSEWSQVQKSTENSDDADIQTLPIWNENPEGFADHSGNSTMLSLFDADEGFGNTDHNFIPGGTDSTPPGSLVPESADLGPIFMDALMSPEADRNSEEDSFIQSSL